MAARPAAAMGAARGAARGVAREHPAGALAAADAAPGAPVGTASLSFRPASVRSEEHTSELQSLMRISYAVFCLKKKKKTKLEISATSSAKLLNTPMSCCTI